MTEAEHPETAKPEGAEQSGGADDLGGPASALGSGVESNLSEDDADTAADPDSPADN